MSWYASTNLNSNDFDSIAESLGAPVVNGPAPNAQAMGLPINGQAAVSVPALPAQAILTPAAEPVGTPSECLLLKNMFDPATEVCDFLVYLYLLVPSCLMFYIFMQTDPDFDMDIKDDVEEECSKYGRVKHIYVDRWVYQLYHISLYPRLTYIVYDYFSEPVIGLQDFCISIMIVKYQDDLEIRTISLKKCSKWWVLIFINVFYFG